MGPRPLLPSATGATSTSDRIQSAVHDFAMDASAPVIAEPWDALLPDDNKSARTLLMSPVSAMAWTPAEVARLTPDLSVSKHGSCPASARRLQRAIMGRVSPSVPNVITAIFMVAEPQPTQDEVSDVFF
jgi:hypothetical protein